MLHTPVLLQQVIEELNIKPGGRYIDATFGLGGHSREIVKHGGPGTKVLALDWDSHHVETMRGVLKEEGSSIQLVTGNFADIEQIAKDNHFTPSDGIVFDLGISMAQIRDSGRGFSYEKLEEPLDMRIDTNLEVTAEDILNTYSREQLYDMIAGFSETLNAKKVVDAIVGARRKRRIVSVDDLLQILKQVDRTSTAQVFQALRIEVNHEFENIEKGLSGGINIMAKGGRIAIITFHPIEDRIVKQFIQKRGLHTNKKPIVSSSHVSFERSAKLRIIYF